MIKYLDGKSLAEKQRLYFNGSHCPYCDQPTQWVDSIIVYQESQGMIYYCKWCQAWCGCHHKDSDKSYGFVATKYLRSLRHECHSVFDPLWQSKVHYGQSPKQAQIAARKWLSDQLKIPVSITHIGMFDIEQCRQVIDLCKPFHLTEEQKEQRKIKVQERIGALLFATARVSAPVQEFNINGFLQYEIVHPKKGTFKYKPSQNIVQLNNSAWKPVEDIESFINENF